jgi:hypothetical protein
MEQLERTRDDPIYERVRGLGAISTPFGVAPRRLDQRAKQRAVCGRTARLTPSFGA